MSDTIIPLNPALPENNRCREVLRRFFQRLEKGDTSPETAQQEAEAALREVAEGQPPGVLPNGEAVCYLHTALLLNILRDLAQQSWGFSHSDEDLLAFTPEHAAEESDSSVKSRVRQSLTWARNQQLKQDRQRALVRKMEQPQRHRGARRSIKDLLLAPEALAEDLERLLDAPEEEREEEIAASIDPYLQFASPDKVDDFTGLRLIDVWRYCRYTWSLPHHTVPGRRMYFLIRDRARPGHPIMGLGALASSFVQITARDRFVGWSPLALHGREDVADWLKRGVLPHVLGLLKDANYERAAEWLDGGDEKHMLDSDIESQWREMTTANILKARAALLEAEFGADLETFLRDLLLELDDAVAKLYLDDVALTSDERTRPSEDTLKRIAALREKAPRASRNATEEGDAEGKAQELSEIEADAQSPRYTRKRLTELLRLLTAKRTLQRATDEADSANEAARQLLSSSSGRRAIKTALRSQKKAHVAASIMDITTCGAIPPYNQVLGGKLVGLLMASPEVIARYKARYEDSVSVITSRMRGEEVTRPSDLALLGTTSLYHTRSSQYNRLRAPVAKGELRFHEIGRTDGYGSVHISTPTYQLMKRYLVVKGEAHSYEFGAGTSFKMRTIAGALSQLGLSELQKHKTPRLVYMVPLATNWRAYLLGRDDTLDSLYDDINQPEAETRALVDYWKERWFVPRVQRKGTLRKVREEEKVRVSKIATDAADTPLFERMNMNGGPERKAEASTERT